MGDLLIVYMTYKVQVKPTFVVLSEAEGAFANLVLDRNVFHRLE